MPNNKKIAAIVVTYNRKNLLGECIEALLSQKNHNLDIFIIDSASTDGTADFVASLAHPQIKYFNTGKNLGGAGGFNFGLKIISKLDYDYYWLMDDDTIVHTDTLETLLLKASELKNNFSFLSSVVLWTDGKLCSMNTPATSSKSIANYEAIKHGLLQIDSCSFVSCFINAEYVKKAGLPISDFFIYGDDMEYTLRLSKYAPGYLNPYSIVTHKMKNNHGIDIIHEPKNRIDRYYYNFRNLTYIYHKYNPREYRVHKLKRLYLTFKILAKSKDAKFKRIHILNRGYRDGKKFNPKIEKI